MYFKLMQKVVAFFAAIITMLFPQTPSNEIRPSKPLVNVNPNPISSAVSTQDVTVMTYNIKINGDGLRTVEKRLPLIVDEINKYSPDSVGLQEADKGWIDGLAAELKNYGRVGKFRDDGIEKGESSSIFYLKDKYELVDSGDFWLSETPDVPSKNWDAGHFRILTYAILKNKETGFTYAHFNTHFDNVSELARTESVAIVAEKIAKIAPDIPVVFTGDLNFKEGSNNYKNILACGLRDTKYLAEEYDSHSTYHGYHVIYPSTKPIDFIFVNGYCSSVKSSRIDSSLERHILASDHFPIIVEMTLFNGGKN